MNRKLVKQVMPEAVLDTDRGICPFCGHEVLKVVQAFRDLLSWREFLISGLCQKCQDEMFGKEEE